MQIFSPILWIFILFMISFAVQKFFSLFKSHWLIYDFIFITLDGGSKKKKSSYDLYQKLFAYVFLKELDSIRPYN